MSDLHFGALMNPKSLIILFLILFSYSCKVDLNGKVTTGSSAREFSLGGNCAGKDGLTTEVCVEYDDYYNSESTMEAHCDTMTDLYDPEGVDVTSFYYGDFDACPSSNRVGKCSVKGKRFFYYNSEFASGSAESDCTSMAGTFSNN